MRWSVYTGADLLLKPEMTVKIARLIQAIWEDLSFTASAGVSYNKPLAKIA